MTYTTTRLDIATAYEDVVRHIWNRGEIIITEDGATTREVRDIKIVVLEPHKGNRLSTSSPLQLLATKQYSKDLRFGCKNEFEYDYHERLFNYNGVNQIEYIKNKLKSNITSRRSVAITWMPEIDEKRKDVPCLQFIQFLIRRGKLEMYVLFRSEDMLTAAAQNMYGLTDIQSDIAKELNIEPGTYTHYVIAGHIYETDIDKMSKFGE